MALPADHARPRTQAFRGAVQWLSLPAPVAAAALALGRQQRATPFITLMAAFMTLVHAHSGQEDVLVGSPSAMRTHPELERLVGLFANTLVYRTSFAGRPSFRTLLGRVRETALGVYQHQDLPFEKIVEAVRPPRDPSRNPLVQVNIRVEGREPELRLRGLQCDPIPIDPGIARFDLAIELGATDDGFAGYLEYDTALFEPSTAALLADHFVRLLDAAVSSPDAALDALDPVRELRPGPESRSTIRPILVPEIAEPRTEEEFEAYYRLRYERLRKPLGLPWGSERDDPAEPSSIHLIAKLDGQVVGAACLAVGIRKDPEAGSRQTFVRLRQIAVSSGFEHRSVGSALIREIDERARRFNAVEIVTNARVENVVFFNRNGYVRTGPGTTLFGGVEHASMAKRMR